MPGRGGLGRSGGNNGGGGGAQSSSDSESDSGSDIIMAGGHRNSGQSQANNLRRGTHFWDQLRHLTMYKYFQQPTKTTNAQKNKESSRRTLAMSACACAGARLVEVRRVQRLRDEDPPASLMGCHAHSPASIHAILRIHFMRVWVGACAWQIVRLGPAS